MFCPRMFNDQSSESVSTYLGLYEEANPLLFPTLQNTFQDKAVNTKAFNKGVSC